MEKITTSKAPTPAGHYSQGIRANGFIFVSGQLGIDPQNPDAPPGKIEEQAHQTIKNVRAVLRAGGTDLDRVVKATVYIANIKYWAKVNEIYASYFGDHKPARAIVPTRDLHDGLLIEMEVIALPELF